MIDSHYTRLLQNSIQLYSLADRLLKDHVIRHQMAVTGGRLRGAGDGQEEAGTALGTVRHCCPVGARHRSLTPLCQPILRR